MIHAGNTQPPAAARQARALVWRADDSSHTGRTVRSLRAAGFAAEQILECATGEVAAALREGGPILILRAGAWLMDPAVWTPPPASATGKGLCAVGAVQPLRVLASGSPGGPAQWSVADPSLSLAGGGGVDESARTWSRLLAETGGDLNRLVDSGSVVSFDPPALFLDSRGALALTQIAMASMGDLLRAALASLRVVHFAPLDAADDPNLRVMQVITSLQRGGAERVTLDLAAELPGCGVRPRLVTLGRPSRAAFAAPAGTIDLADAGGNWAARLARLTNWCVADGADLVHAHLVTGDVAGRLAEAGLPVMLTVHNTREAWPPGLAQLRPADAVLLAACATAVESELLAAGSTVPVRTVRNGLDLHQFRLTPERLAGRNAWRRRWSFGEDDFILIALANPRPQKRLDRLPAILAEVRRRLSPGREARLVLGGEPMRGNPQAAESVARVRREVARLGLEAHVHWTGAVADVGEVLAGADVLVSVSAHEGLSLAWLEALAMGLPVVATDVGGAQEVARDHSAFQVLPSEASAAAFADTLVACGSGGNSPPPEAFLRHWSSRQMALRYAWLYRRVLATASSSGRGRGVWLVTNNFSTGGAQSSARRLLIALAAQGLAVRAAVIEEHPDRPTPGRRALMAAGIPVLCAGPPENLSATLEILLRAIDGDPAQSVLFWNLRPSFKVALADALLNLPIFDISPGRMFFDSWEQHFAKTEGSWPYRTAREYGARLAGVIVKYHAEAAQASRVLGAPVSVVPNGVPVPRAGDSLAPALVERPSASVIFGTAARIHPQKRLEDLIAAFRLAGPSLPPSVLRIAGGTEDGCLDYQARLRQLGEGLPVEWLGEVSDLATFHRGLDVFVMISEPAGCPNASLEAMAAGLPLIATDVGGASEQVIEGQTGRLITPGDLAAFAAAMVELASDAALRRTLGAGGHALVQEKFSLDRMVSDYRRICLPEAT